VILLDMDPDCRQPPTRALVISELTTFLNQIEAHLGKPAIIAPSAAFESEYQISNAINRTLALRREFFVPDYANRPWVMWQANSYRQIAGVDGFVRWNAIAKSQ
jgi:lysozyme